MKTVQDAIDKKNEPKKIERDREAEVLPMLPPDILAPIVYSGGATTREDGYHVGFSDPSYGRGEGYDPASILRALEDHGFTPCETTLAQWDQWRPTPEPYAAEKIPPSGKYEITDCWSMLSCWISCHQHTGPDFHVFYMFNGERFKVSLDLPRHIASVQATRVEFRGGWRYGRNTAWLQHSDKIHDIRDDEGNALAGRHCKSFAQAGVVSGQDSDGRIYWEASTDPFTMSPASVLAYILD